MRTDRRAKRRGFLGRANKSINPGFAGLHGPSHHQVRYHPDVAGFREVGIVVRRQHGDGEDAQACRAGRDRRAHGLRVGMHGQEACPNTSDALHPFRHRVADVVQLEIEEHLLAGARQRLGEPQPAREGKLISDLVESDCVAELLDQSLSAVDRSDIESDDQAITWVHISGIRCQVSRVRQFLLPDSRYLVPASCRPKPVPAAC